MPKQRDVAVIVGSLRKASLFDNDGALRNDKTREYMTTFVTAFSTWIETLAG